MAVYPAVWAYGFTTESPNNLRHFTMESPPESPFVRRRGVAPPRNPSFAPLASNSTTHCSPPPPNPRVPSLVTGGRPPAARQVPSAAGARLSPASWRPRPARPPRRRAPARFARRRRRCSGAAARRAAGGREALVEGEARDPPRRVRDAPAPRVRDALIAHARESAGCCPRNDALVAHAGSPSRIPRRVSSRRHASAHASSPCPIPAARAPSGELFPGSLPLRAGDLSSVPRVRLFATSTSPPSPTRHAHSLGRPAGPRVAVRHAPQAMSTRTVARRAPSCRAAMLRVMRLRDGGEQ